MNIYIYIYIHIYIYRIGTKAKMHGQAHKHLVIINLQYKIFKDKSFTSNLNNNHFTVTFLPLFV